MDWGLGGSPLFACLFWVFAEKASFFYDAICTTARKACIVRTCKPLVNDHCVEALMTIPFELPTLLFFHGLNFYSVRQGKQERNGHFLAEQLCETRLPLCFVCDGFVAEQNIGRPEESAKVQSIGRWIEVDFGD